MKTRRYCNSRIGKAHLRPPSVTQRKTSESVKPKKDEIILSPRAAEVRKLKELTKTIPDVRQEKVQAIKKQIESGEYKVSPESVAKSIIDLHVGIRCKKPKKA